MIHSSRIRKFHRIVSKPVDLFHNAVLRTYQYLNKVWNMTQNDVTARWCVTYSRVRRSEAQLQQTYEWMLLDLQSSHYTNCLHMCLTSPVNIQLVQAKIHLSDDIHEAKYKGDTTNYENILQIVYKTYISYHSCICGGSRTNVNVWASVATNTSYRLYNQRTISVLTLA